MLTYRNLRPIRPIRCKLYIFDSIFVFHFALIFTIWLLKMLNWLCVPFFVRSKKKTPNKFLAYNTKTLPSLLLFFLLIIFSFWYTLIFQYTNNTPNTTHTVINLLPSFVFCYFSSPSIYIFHINIMHFKYIFDSHNSNLLKWINFSFFELTTKPLRVHNLTQCISLARSVCVCFASILKSKQILIVRVCVK